MLNLESCVLSNYKRKSTTKAREPKRGKCKSIYFLLNSFLSSLVYTQAFQSLQHVEDDHVGTKLETELWEGSSDCLAQVKVIPGKYCCRILYILARYFIAWPGIHGCQPVPVRQAGAGAAQQCEHQGEEKNEKK